MPAHSPCRRIRDPRIACSLAAIAVLGEVSTAFALDRTKGPKGLNHDRAHAAPFVATGVGINVVVIDDPVSAANTDLGARLKGTLNFEGRTPQQNDGGDPAASANAATAHASLSADIIGSSHATWTGVANASNIFAADVSGVATKTELMAVLDFYFEKANLSGTNKNAEVFNLSLPFSPDAQDNGANQTSKFVDWFVRTRDVMVIKSAGNTGGQINNPGDAFNVITVGGTDEVGNVYSTVANYSAYLLSSDTGGNNAGDEDWRGKPDIVAPGTNIDNRAHQNTGTSFATPHVAGMAALLAEKGLSGTADNRDHLAQKAIILNSARKRFINVPENAERDAFDNRGGQASDGNYLTGAGALVAGSDNIAAAKSALWSPTKWSTDAQGKRLTVLRPLDDEQGTGLADAERALIQFDAGEHEENQAGGVPLIGWNREFLAADTAPDRYALNQTIYKGSFITATLTWDRHIDEQEAGGAAGDNNVESTDQYVDGGPYGFLPDFDLFIYFKDELVAESISIGNSLFGNNVEHLHYPVFQDGLPLDYSIRVDLRGSGLDLTSYALAWWTVPEPTAAFAMAGAALGALLRRRRRD
jgi:hypothetical protein